MKETLAGKMDEHLIYLIFPGIHNERENMRTWPQYMSQATQDNCEAGERISILITIGIVPSRGVRRLGWILGVMAGFVSIGGISIEVCAVDEGGW